MGVVSVQASCALLRTDRPTRPNFQRLHDGQILHMRHAQIERRPLSQEFILIFVNKLDGDLESESVIRSVPHSLAGRFAIVTGVERGIWWTCWVAALVRGRTIPTRTQNRVVLASRR
jgi:hypothetical protein